MYDEVEVFEYIISDCFFEGIDVCLGCLCFDFYGDVILDVDGCIECELFVLFVDVFVGYIGYVFCVDDWDFEFLCVFEVLGFMVGLIVVVMDLGVEFEGIVCLFFVGVDSVVWFSV